MALIVSKLSRVSSESATLMPNCSSRNMTRSRKATESRMFESISEASLLSGSSSGLVTRRWLMNSLIVSSTSKTLLTLCECSLEHLLRACLGQLGDERHLPRNRVERQPPLAVINDVLVWQLGAVARHDERLGGLAKNRIGDADDGSLDHLRHLGQHVLDLFAAD